MDIGERIQSFAESLGVDYVGVADLAEAREFILDQGGPTIAQYPFGVAMGIALVDPIVDLLPDRERNGGGALYKHHAYDVVNATLDQIAMRVASMLQREGYRAFPVAASKRVDDARICGPISQKLVAHLAGLGWIGKSCLLVTPDHGPRVRWVTVLTDAPLPPTGSPMESRCGTCQACVAACPVQAFTGRVFDPDEPREARYDAAACDRFFKEEERRTGIPVCGMCLWVCPYGRSRPAAAPDRSTFQK
ncbi:4Fe-4S double cluster binding domain-containing protein [Methanosphaerula subterraneus]|uniref:4Fe-4S double cluster binding domain-containing protein n=1 Tax=Methanosphaerula subterraneus TaxID=3350244 RepID=UPI003F86770F